MTINGEVIFLALAIAVYIYIIINRICQSFETCANHKMMAAMYSKMDPKVFQQMIKSTEES